jgi:hypothetical protein
MQAENGMSELGFRQHSLSGSIILVQELVACIADRVCCRNLSASREETELCKCCYLPQQLQTTEVVLISNYDQKRSVKNKKNTKITSSAYGVVRNNKIRHVSSETS